MIIQRAEYDSTESESVYMTSNDTKEMLSSLMPQANKMSKSH